MFIVEKEKSAEALERARRTMTNDLKATKTTKRESSAAADADGEAALPSWAEAFVFLRKIGVDDSASVEAVFPDDSLNTAMMTDIRNSAVLKPMRGGTKTSESHFLFRIRDKLASSYGGDEMLKGTNDEVIGTAVTKTTVFLNCYVLYRQQLLTVVDSSGKPLKGRKPELMRQAIVLVTKWPFPQLAFRLLSKLEEAFFWQIGRIDMGDGTLLIDDSRDNSKVQSSTEITNESAKNVLMVGFGQTAMWPVAKPGQRLYLHFLGEMLQYNVSSDALSTYGANLSFNSVFTSINLVSLLGPYGLVQHLWILWELIIMGQDIVVFSSSPTQCSEVVLALASLTHPMNNVSDFRPYIYKDDSDIRIIALGALGKKRQYGIDTRGSVSGSKEKDKGGSGSSSAGDCKSVIVGTTEPLVLSRLEAFGAAIFLSPEPYGGPPSDPDAPYKGKLYLSSFSLVSSVVWPTFHLSCSLLYLLSCINRNSDVYLAAGMRTKNAAYYYFLDGGSTNPQTLKAVNNPSTSNTSNWNMKSFTEYFNEWVERGSTKAALVCRHEPSALVQKKTLEKIKKMSPTDRILLGDKLLRDNLHNLTMTYYKPIIDTGVTAEVVQMREVALERAEINHQRAQQAQQEANLLKESLLQFVTESIGFALKFPEWAPHNVPTLLLYGVYMVVFFAAYLLKVPKVVLVSALFLMELPEKAPREFEALLRNIFPKYFLYPKRYNKDGTRIGGQPSDPQARTESRTVLETGGEQGEEDVEEEVSDEIRRQFNGHYRRSRHENLDALLAFQGRNYVQRKINLSLQPTRTFTLSADNRVVRVHERGGPMNTDETFVIGDPDRELDVMGMQKLLTRYYWEGNTLVGRIAILPAKTMVTTAYFEVITNNGKKEIANVSACHMHCLFYGCIGKQCSMCVPLNS